LEEEHTYREEAEPEKLRSRGLRKGAEKAPRGNTSLSEKRTCRLTPPNLASGGEGIPQASRQKKQPWDTNSRIEAENNVKKIVPYGQPISPITRKKLLFGKIHSIFLMRIGVEKK